MPVVACGVELTKLKMKTTLLLCTLAVLAITQAAVIKQGPADLILGAIQPGDRLLRRIQMFQEAVPMQSHIHDLIFIGNETNVINAIFAIEEGEPQYASVIVRSGGIGTNQAVVRVRSRQSFGYNYWVSIWGTD
ncbi:transcription activator MBF2 domain-containing protein [Phthorimaea operculella]|nr:transcription activator MBF2 domain-containing protein [Phthorimaea operculella]